MCYPPYLVSAFAERWHEETSNFHMSAEEVTVTLDDVSCLLHLSNEGRLSDHQYVDKEEGTRLMVDLTGSDPADIEMRWFAPKGRMSGTHICKGISRPLWGILLITRWRGIRIRF
jgi:hypothetical protein